MIRHRNDPSPVVILPTGQAGRRPPPLVVRSLQAKRCPTGRRSHQHCSLSGQVDVRRKARWIVHRSYRSSVPRLPLRKWEGHILLLDCRSRLNFSRFSMEMQSVRNQHLLDSLEEHSVYANQGQRYVAPHQIAEGMNSEGIIPEFLEPQVSQPLSLQTVDPIGTAAIWLLAKPPFVLMQREPHCKVRRSPVKTGD